jgi:lipoprotein-releasing system ATP-binding protein
LEAMVKVTDLHKTFFLGSKAIQVLKGANFEVRQGEMVAVVGPSGAGKSTLLHLLGTLDTPTRGKIEIGGEDLSAFPPDKLASFRNRTIGFVFQFHHLLPEFTALENTMMPALIQRIPRARAERMARDILQQVGLSERLDHRPVELSGGEQQRVALARALVLGPRLLLADEPTGNLDDQTSQGIHQLLFDLNRRLGMTTIIVTHNSKLAALLGRTVYLSSGQISSTPGGFGKEGSTPR